MSLAYYKKISDMRAATKEIVTELHKNKTKMSWLEYRKLMREHYFLPEKHYKAALEDHDPYLRVEEFAVEK